MEKNGKKYGYSSINNVTGKRFNTESLLNFTPTKKKDKPLFGGGAFDPYVNIGGGKLRPKFGKNYIGVTFGKKF